MVDEVEIVNVKGDEVASEETLLALLETMKKMATSKGFDPKEVNKKTKDLANNMDSLVDIVDDNTKALEDNTDAKDDNTDSVKRNTNSLASMAGYIAGSTLSGLAGFTKELLVGKDNLSDFAKHIPMVGSLLEPLTGYIDESVDVFREMSQVGATFSGGLSEFRRIAGEAAMPLDEFRRLVQENSESLKLFGTDTAMGARNFAAMSNEFRKGPGRELLNLGFTSSELNQTLMDFAEIQSMMFGAERAQSMITTQNAGEFAHQLQRLSAITGKRRDQIAEEMMQTMSDVRARQAMARMDVDARKRFQANLAIAPESFKQVMIDMVDGLPNEELTRSLYNFSDTFRDQAGNIQNMSESELTNFLVNVRDEMESFASSMDPAVYQQMLNTLGGFSQAMDVSTDLANVRALTDEQIAEQNKRLAKAQERNDAILQFGETLNRIRGDLQVAFINSGIFQTIEKIVGDFTNALSDPATMSMIEDGLNTLSSGLRTVIEAIGGFINDLQYSSLGDAINAFLFGRSEDEQQERLQTESDDLTARIRDLTNILNAPEAAERLSDDQRSQMSTELEGLRARLSEIDIDSAQATEGLFSGFDGASIFGAIKDYFIAGLGDLFTGNFTVNAMVSGITALWAGSKVFGAFRLLTSAVKGVSGLLGGTRGRGGPRIDPPDARDHDRDTDRDTDRDRDRSRRMRLPGGIRGAGILGALFGAVELGSVLTDDTLTRDEKIEQGSGAAGGMAGGMAGAAAGAALGSVVPIVGNVVGGLIGGTLGYFGGSMLGSSVGESITGGSEEISEEQIDEQLSQLESLRRLSEFDLDQTGIEENLSALRLYAEGMNRIPSIQAAGVFETLNAGIVSFLGGDNDPFAPLVAFSNLSLGANTTTNLESVRLFAEAMNQLPEVQQPGVFETLKAGIVSFLGGDNDPFAPLVAFSNLALGENTVANVNAVRLFAEAMNRIPEVQQPGVFETLKAGIISFLGGDNDPFAPLVAFSNLDLGNNVIANAESVRLFATAMNQLPEIDAERAGGFFESIRSIFGSETVMPWDQVREFGEVDINVEAVTANAAAMRAFGDALSGFSNFEVSELDIPNRFTDNLVTLSNINGNGLQNIATGLESIVGVTGVRDQLDAINEGLDPAGIRTYADAIDQLVERLTELNDVLSESNDTLFRDNMSAAEVLGNINVSTQGSTDGISQLNTLLSQMLAVLNQSKEIENKIERNTASLSSDTLSGRVSRIR